MCVIHIGLLSVRRNSFLFVHHGNSLYVQHDNLLCVHHDSFLRVPHDTSDLPFCGQQWGAADAEIKVPSGENTEL